MATLTAKNLAKTCRGRRVVEDVSLTVSSGEITGLLGPDGTDKTATLYVVVGTIPRDVSSIIIDDGGIGLLPLHAYARRSIGYLPQETSILCRPGMSDSLMTVLQVRDDLTSGQWEDHAGELMKEFHIGRPRGSLGQSLSGNKRHRTEVARALTASPKFILLDEPLAGIDPIPAIDTRRIIERPCDSGLGVLITGHNIHEALAMCERAYTVNQRYLITYGAPIEILQDEHVKRVYLGGGFKLWQGRKLHVTIGENNSEHEVRFAAQAQLATDDGAPATTGYPSVAVIHAGASTKTSAGVEKQPTTQAN